MLNHGAAVSVNAIFVELTRTHIRYGNLPETASTILCQFILFPVVKRPCDSNSSEIWRKNPKNDRVVFDVSAKPAPCVEYFSVKKFLFVHEDFPP